jgi:hypothetical protein
MPDIIVTTPKSEMSTAAEEAKQLIEEGGGQYFRTFKSHAPKIDVGERVYYVEDGYIRGFAIVSSVQNGQEQCSTTMRDWGYGTQVFMDASSWKWIRPIAMQGFQGWRYSRLSADDVVIVGGWLDPKPAVVARKFLKRGYGTKKSEGEQNVSTY